MPLSGSEQMVDCWKTHHSDLWKKKLSLDCLAPLGFFGDVVESKGRCGCRTLGEWPPKPLNRLPSSSEYSVGRVLSSTSLVDLILRPFAGKAQRLWISKLVSSRPMDHKRIWDTLIFINFCHYHICKLFVCILIPKQLSSVKGMDWCFYLVDLLRWWSDRYWQDPGSTMALSGLQVFRW